MQTTNELCFCGWDSFEHWQICVNASIHLRLDSICDRLHGDSVWNSNMGNSNQIQFDKICHLKRMQYYQIGRSLTYSAPGVDRKISFECNENTKWINDEMKFTLLRNVTMMYYITSHHTARDTKLSTIRNGILQRKCITVVEIQKISLDLFLLQLQKFVLREEKV